MEIKKLSDVAFIDISGVDKKTKDGETNVKLCNFTDVYYNWSVDKCNILDFMNASANSNEIQRFSLHKGNVAITKDSETRDDIGIACYIADDLDNTVLGYHTALIVPNKNVLNGSYLNAYLHTNTARKYFSNQASGSGQRYTLTIGGIGSVRIPIINIDEQKKIGYFFETIEKKIKVNKSINIELESMAKTLYDYWFLQFEFPNKEGKPYKSSGGKMVWNDELKREIPEGWEVKKLNDLVILGNTNKFNGKNANAIDLSVMPSDSISLNELNSSNNFDTNLFEMKKGDILFGSIRPYLHKAGIAPCDGAYAGTVHCFRCIDDSYYNFALITLCSANMFDYANKNSKGTKMPVIDSDRILDYPVPFNKDIISKFNHIDLKNAICSNVMENQELASLRDFLLPLLMNGQAVIK